MVKTQVGDQFKYTLTVNNATGAGQWFEAQVKDTLPSEVAYVPNSTEIDGQSQTDRQIWQGNQLAVNLGNLKGGQTHTITFMVKTTKVATSGNIINIAKLNGQDDTGYQTSYQDRADVFVEAIPSVPVTPSTPDTTQPGNQNTNNSKVGGLLPQTGVAKAGLAVAIGLILIAGVLGYQVLQRRKRQ